MEEFDPIKINQYSIEQLIEYLNNGFTLEEIKQCGLNYLKREQLVLRLEEDYWAKLCQNPVQRIEDYEAYINLYPKGKHVEEGRKIIEELKIAIKTDETDWKVILIEDTYEAYQFYLKKHPEGAHAQEARERMNPIPIIPKPKVIKLLADMRAEPWKYNNSIMRMLFHGADEGTIQAIRESTNTPGLELATDFILNRMKITIKDLHDYGVVPQHVTETDVCAPDFQMPPKTVKEIGSFPANRTDIYFIGVPRSGKTSVLAGIIYHLWQTGRAGYEPHIVDGIDPCGDYYIGLIQALGNKKPPAATPDDTVSFMKLNIQNTLKRINEVTIVELSGEAFYRIAYDMSSEEFKAVWESLGATKCLQSSNRKCLFFVLDYSIISGKGGDERYAPPSQSFVLQSALRVFSHDGPNPKDPTRDCTMSKVDNVAVIMTKSDLMDNAVNRAQRTEIAEECIRNHFGDFMNELIRTCKKFGINRAGNYLPYILTFSLGNFYVGNTVVFDPTDTEELIRYICQVTPAKRRNIFNLFG